MRVKSIHQPIFTKDMHEPRKENKMAKDVVCGMEVDEATAEWKTEYKGETYYFCAPGCKRAFENDPEKYLGQSSMHMDHHGGGHSH